MSDEPIKVVYLVHKKDRTGGILSVDVTYDNEDERPEAIRLFTQYLVDNDLELYVGPIAHKTLVQRREDWDANHARRKAQIEARDARRGALRTMGEDYDTYNFNDFQVGPELEKLLDDDATDELSHYDERVEAVYDLLRDCFEAMRTEGEWRYDHYDDGKLSGGRFVYEPSDGAELWCGDGFPFTLDFRPTDILPALMEEMINHTEDVISGEDIWSESVAEEFDEIEATLEGWMKAFANAIVAVRQRADELKAKSP